MAYNYWVSDRLFERLQYWIGKREEAEKWLLDGVHWYKKVDIHALRRVNKTFTMEKIHLAALNNFHAKVLHELERPVLELKEKREDAEMDSINNISLKLPLYTQEIIDGRIPDVFLRLNEAILEENEACKVYDKFHCMIDRKEYELVNPLCSKCHFMRDYI